MSEARAPKPVVVDVPADASDEECDTIADSMLDHLLGPGWDEG